MTERVGLVVHAESGPGILHQITGVIADHGGDIVSVDILESSPPETRVYFELDLPGPAEDLAVSLSALQIVHRASIARSMGKIYGKRIIIIGGGAQVGQVAVGAISEADRHNIRGERISVDTIPLVGEQELAGAVRAVARLPRARVLVLAGALMGGAITEAVRDVQARGIIVIALNMVGSVREAADLVVTDPLQAGVMAVMAIADTARFDISKQRRRQY